jgi:microcystin degradation protein MlrC
MRALIAGLVHESSTFMTDITGPTTMADFDVHVGDELLAEFRGTNTCVGGYLAACERRGVTVVPVLHARAEPSAAVDPVAYEVLAKRLVEGVRAARDADLALLDLHGAATLTTGSSLDLALLRIVRAVLGPDMPIAVTMDLHANLPADLPPLVDVLVGFHEYPHTDMASRAELAGELAIQQALGHVRPIVRKLDLPILVPAHDDPVRSGEGGTGLGPRCRDRGRSARLHRLPRISLRRHGPGVHVGADCLRR